MGCGASGQPPAASGNKGLGSCLRQLGATTKQMRFENDDGDTDRALFWGLPEEPAIVLPMAVVEGSQAWAEAQQAADYEARQADAEQNSGGYRALPYWSKDKDGPVAQVETPEGETISIYPMDSELTEDAEAFRQSTYTLWQRGKLTKEQAVAAMQVRSAVVGCLHERRNLGLPTPPGHAQAVARTWV